jgi:hypothetical protein
MAISIAELIGSFNEAWSGKTELLDAVVTDDWDDIPLAPDDGRVEDPAIGKVPA